MSTKKQTTSAPDSSKQESESLIPMFNSLENQLQLLRDQKFNYLNSDHIFSILDDMEKTMKKLRKSMCTK